MNPNKGVKVILDAFNGMSRCSLISIATLLILLIVLTIVLVTVFAFGNPCKELDNCDAFKPICAASNHGTHQFFYSQCDMERENCMTGQKWKRDSFSHCNVYIEKEQNWSN